MLLRLPYLTLMPAEHLMPDLEAVIRIGPALKLFLQLKGGSQSCW